ncbi:hypothetical protein ACFW04_012907 [Cataglyphis niger]
MLELKNILRKCIIIGANLSPSINSERYLSSLSDESSEINYAVFRSFACACSDTVLAALYKLGYFDDFDELLHIAGEIVEMREAFNHEEEDAGGLISFLLAQHRGNRLTHTYAAENTRQFRRFGITGREASFAIRPLHGDINIYRALENAFREIHAYVLNTCQPGDYVGLSFHSANLAHGPAGISFRPAHDLTYEDIWRVISSVAQSAGCLDIAERFDIRVFNVSVPSGRGRAKLTREDVAKRSIITINNADNLCFPRSLVVARVYCERGNLRMGKLHEKWNNIRHPHSSLQRELAIQLVRNAGVTITKEGCGIAEIERFQRYLAVDNIAIVVYNFATFARGAKPMYDGIATLAFLEREPTLRLNVMYYERLRHYNPIVNLNAAAGCRNYCEPCNIGYRNDKTGHRCPSKCPRCFILPSCKQSDAEIIKCNACKRAFFGKAMKHECGVSYCRLCQSPKPENHLCYMQPLRHNDDSSNELLTSSSISATVPSKKERVAFVFYDFETR